MNYQIYIDIGNNNSNLNKLANQLYNLFTKNNYNVTILNSNEKIDDKIKKLNNSNKKLVISNELNSQNDEIELLYSLRDTDELVRYIENDLRSLANVSKYYQLRLPNNTKLDYYELLRDINNNQSIIIKYGSNYLNNWNNIAKNIYESINNYLRQKNIYTVKSGDSLYSISKNFNTTVDEIKKLNNLKTNSLSIGQKLLIPNQSSNINNNSNDSNNNNDNNNYYIVKSGDSLYSISKNFNTTVDEIKRINNLTSNILSIEQKLLIPNQANNINTNYYIVKSGDSLYSISKNFNTTVDEIKRINNLTSNILSIGQKLLISNQVNNSNNNYYIVKSGDSLYSISKKYNTTVDEIKRLNNLTSNILSINQKLLI